MGSDLCINRNFFRIAYEGSDLLSELYLDYCAWFMQFLDDKGDLTPDKAEIVLSEIESRWHLLGEIDDLRAKRAFGEKHDEIVALLRGAIERDEPIRWSI
jgi:hypothetical protein